MSPEEQAKHEATGLQFPTVILAVKLNGCTVTKKVEISNADVLVSDRTQPAVDDAYKRWLEKAFRHALRDLHYMLAQKEVEHERL